MNLAQQKDEHIGELTLRRRRAGEALGPDAAAIDAHATSCADCRARLRALDDEQRRFEQEISFDRFAAGVERAARSASKAKARRPGAAERVGGADAGDGGLRGRAGHRSFRARFQPSRRTARKGGAGITCASRASTGSATRASIRPSRSRAASGCASATSRVRTAT